ncbi:toll/interleukin-1 receptor domain-containing protein [Peribacillus frigoritolerans]|uniref:toll/interleukin-1 receptor domain-containing protein n=2 Tax=Peribacillus frigoritolerans TaxID=450367 RepID=UPI002E205D44|nr:TIR domain-containing protein [Peribacillus frigoritolerans]MED4690408.1 TIR domain-containing protein [Peribacillus frigoritolerans]
MENIIVGLKDDLISFITKKGFTINENALNILIEGELLCFNKNISFFSSYLLLPLINKFPEFKEIINKYGGDSKLATEFIEEIIDRNIDYDGDKYTVEDNYSTENWLNERFQTIDGCIRNSKENNRFVINESDIVLSILDIYDNAYPPYDNGLFNDINLQTPYNTICHIVGYFSEYLWVKNDDIRWELSNLNKKNYDIAISFAGEDRKTAEEIAEKLIRLGIRVFYDNFERANLWGKNLYTHLSDVYGEKAKYCLMIVSKSYEKKHWTNLERQAAQAKAFREEHEYILPLRLDDTEIPGLLPTTGYVDIRDTDISEIVELIIQKISQTPNTKP